MNEIFSICFIEMWLKIQIILGDIEKVQNFIKLMDINGHNSESVLEDTALIKSIKSGKSFYLFQY